MRVRFIRESLSNGALAAVFFLSDDVCVSPYVPGAECFDVQGLLMKPHTHNEVQESWLCEMDRASESFFVSFSND